MKKIAYLIPLFIFSNIVLGAAPRLKVGRPKKIKIVKKERKNESTNPSGYTKRPYKPWELINQAKQEKKHNIVKPCIIAGVACVATGALWYINSMMQAAESEK
ncbi:MAG: hypothetical protein WC707_01440 [Candidatus Babeliaceae bacterium]|jgi:hypothetical protein